MEIDIYFLRMRRTVFSTFFSQVVVSIKIRPSIVLIKENMVLLMKYHYSEALIWGIPGGGVGEGETLVDALKRELLEELGVKINISNLLCLVETPTAGKVKHTLHCVFLGEVASGEPKANPEHTSSVGAEWIGIEEIGGLILYPPINDFIKLALKSKTDSELAKVIPEYLGMRERPWF